MSLLLVIGRGVSGEDLAKQGILLGRNKKREKRAPTNPVVEVARPDPDLEARRAKDRERYYRRKERLGPEGMRALWRAKGKTERAGHRADVIRKAKRDSYHRRKAVRNA